MHTFKPDYGLRLIKDGTPHTAEQIFYDFRLTSLTLLGDGRYSTMVEFPFAGNIHALSLDFNTVQLEQILAKANPSVKEWIKSKLEAGIYNGETLDFEGEIVFGVRARLGKTQKVQREEFAPLIAQEIF